MRRIDFNTTTSTNDHARRWLEDNPGEPIIVTARVQTAGRGRFGRRWSSPEGGCWLTLARPLAAHPPACVTIAAALGVAEAIDGLVVRAAPSYRPDELVIRWPNDLLLNGGKVAGLLGETVFTREAPALLLGVGVNVNNSVERLAAGEPLRTPGTSLSDRAGRPLDLGECLDAIAGAVSGVVTRFEREGFDEDVRRRVSARLAWVGERVRLEETEGGVEGRLLGIDNGGALLLEIDGERHALVSGELSCRPVGGVPGGPVRKGER